MASLQLFSASSSHPFLAAMFPDLEKQTSEITSANDDSQSAEVNPELLVEPGEQQSSPLDRGTAPGKSNPFPKTRFGLKRPDFFYDPIAATHDYTVKYKADPVFHELDDNARVWFVYNDEADAFDTDMIEEASDSLDILLVFAGLFSAVLTTFLVQTVQLLSPDNSSISAALLQELVQLQRAQGSQATPPADVCSGPSNFDIWVNGLWFTSLTLSLSSALLAVLAKQWLRSYRSLSTGTPRNRALMRQFRFDGFDMWKVRPIIGFLPIILHGSLILFLIGLVVFLAPLNVAIAAVIGVITFILLAIYFITNLLPLKFVQCPYRTPLTSLVHCLLQLCFKKRFKRSLIGRQNASVSERSNPVTGKLDGEYEALTWLYRTTASPSAKKVVYQCMGALQPPKVQVIGTKRLLDLKSVHQAEIPHDTGVLWVRWLHAIHELGHYQLLPKRTNQDSGSLTQSQRDDIKRHILGTINLGIQDGISPILIRGLKDMKFSYSDLGLALIVLACSNPREMITVCIHDQDGERPVVELHNTNAFPWIMDNYNSLTIPKLPPVVWMRLQDNATWTFEGIEDLSSTNEQFRRCIRAALDSKDSWPSRGPISLETFLGYQIASLDLGLQAALWGLVEELETT